MSDLDSRITQRMNSSSTQPGVETIPSSREHEAHGTIPNTPFAASVISFTLGSFFVAGFLACIINGTWWWATPQLGFFIMALAAFHEGEFLATAGWNRPKCSVDCESSLLVVET